MIKLYHVTAYHTAVNAKIGETFMLFPGTQCSQGRGVYFSENKIREGAAEGAYGAKEKVAIKIVPMDGTSQKWWRSRHSPKKRSDPSKARTWHSDKKCVVCTVTNRYTDSISGMDVVECGYALKRAFELVPALMQLSEKSKLDASAMELITRLEHDVDQSQRDYSLHVMKGKIETNVYAIIASTLGVNNFLEAEGTYFPKSLKQRLFRKNGCVCKVCNKKTNQLDKEMHLEVHHIRPFHLGGQGVRRNGLVLCKQCHVKLHQRTDPLGDKQDFFAEVRNFLRDESVNPSVALTLLPA